MFHPQRSWSTARAAALAAALACLPLAGCSSDDAEAKECKSNAVCPEGQYCGDKGYCTLDCRKDTDCVSGKCSSLGKCVGGSNPDAGVKDLAGSDADLGAPDLPVADLPAPDAPRLDQNVMDLPVNMEAKVPDSSTSPPDAGQDGEAGVLTAWRALPGGSFQMGSLASELCYKATETSHPVTLSNKFEVHETEVTRSQFYALMAYNPSLVAGCTSTCPVENVSWSEAVAYCNALSTQKSLTACYSCSGSGASVSCTVNSTYQGGAIYKCPGYRLPTEAEWEYAARATTTTPLYGGAITNCFGADTVAGSIGWYDQNSGSKAKPVKGKTPNKWSLYDMSGNVMEWTNDWYQASLGSSKAIDPPGPSSGTARVMRGGSWYQSAGDMRSAARFSADPTKRYAFVGFRCVRYLP